MNFFHEVPGSLQRLIIVNLLPFALNTVIKHPFFVTHNAILENQVISLLWKKTYTSLFFLLRVWVTQTPSLLTFLILLNDGRLLRSQVLILEYFGADCIPAILFEHTDQVLMISYR